MDKLKVCKIFKTIKFYDNKKSLQLLTNNICDCRSKCAIKYNMNTYYIGIFNNIQSPKFWNNLRKEK